MEHLELAIALSVQQDSYLVPKRSGFIRDGAAVRKFSERCNGCDHAVEPLFGLLEASLLFNIPGDFVKVMESSWCNLNARSHAVSLAAPQPA